MENKQIHSVFAGILLVSFAFMFGACSKSDIEEPQWEVINIKVNKNDWQWDSKLGRYQAIRDLPELTPSIFSNGAAMAYIKTNATTKAALPYIKTYSYEYKDGSGKTLVGYYTETIKCDFQVGNPSTVTFYIEASDLGRDDEFLKERDFQIVLIGKPGS